MPFLPEFIPALMANKDVLPLKTKVIFSNNVRNILIFVVVQFKICILLVFVALHMPLFKTNDQIANILQGILLA